MGYQPQRAYREPVPKHLTVHQLLWNRSSVSKAIPTERSSCHRSVAQMALTSSILFSVSFFFAV